ncbi:hypothetical protein GTP46_26555 [Duganella sp. FT135W]|uniref:Uncharacterized protein n=1 Tax=Duganella flavida TaxID=2692175 RepID=A0A6L8KGH7_9BURK|nr:hypothetical protein [Duganella flavida]MYM26195.1 hypothetical protein [Duganella flavida]
MYDETFDPRRSDDGYEESFAVQRLLRSQRKSLWAGYVVFMVIALSACVQLLITCLYTQ